MAAGLAVLVDWGSAQPRGKECHGRGVAAFSDRRVFEQRKYAARPGQDAIGLLYSWLAIAFGESCCSPWGLWPRRVAGESADVSVEELRERWVSRHRAEHREVAIVADAIKSLKRRRTGELAVVERALLAIARLH